MILIIHLNRLAKVIDKTGVVVYNYLIDADFEKGVSAVREDFAKREYGDAEQTAQDVQNERADARDERTDAEEFRSYGDNRKPREERHEKKREIAEYSDVYKVPLHRSYGITKRESFFTYLNEYLATALTVILYAAMFIMIAVGLYMLITLLGHVGQLIAILALIWFILWKFFRVPRKRIKFLLKLRRKCRALGYKIEYKRGILRGMRFNKSGADLTVDTGKKLWTVRFLPAKRYNCDFIFEDESTLKIKHNPIRFKSSIMGRRASYVAISKQSSGGGANDKIKIKTLPYSFSEADEIKMNGRKSARALVINPVPHTLKKKEKDGATYETGTGERMWGYTVFSGTGFLETLERESIE